MDEVYIDKVILFVAIIVFCVIAGSIGYLLGSKTQQVTYQDKAITHNCAQYDTQTGEFHWRGE